ncbi:inorganic phosphate transporter [uncultured Duncaniella sp.]|uniref:inorganic phosphate transporter n=1 Tax=uncultured Duncaniella sp. TaxID=2768039 RepID=UPI002674A611|nr:inorganic phosphate transporter [uncultured Duncaniella sp.]MCI9172200.1 inorganic phosphate transporter [Muribaculaceae bacterium]
MDIVFLVIVIFLFLLAIFDLTVGVSNDAVNFLTSAVGSRAASFKRILIVASIGVFIGAAMSNGMMDVARHGIFRPENLSFYDVIAIFMAVMVTDIILLDVFNSLGMPTSTTVSMVFELLGATFVVALFKIAAPGSELGLADLINAERALSVILGIFLSVAIAFVFGTVVQFLTRLIFTFEYKSRMKWKVGLFGGVACTAIVYFMLIKGIKDLTIMTPELKAWIADNTAMLLGVCFVGFTVLMQALHALRINVFKTVVLLGTFSLAMAFAGNDLVNFIGVPLTSAASLQDYMANGGGDVHGFMMGSLNGPAETPFYYLVGAGMIMVVALATSSKARRVTQTTVGLSSQNQGDEMFGSSRLGRALVRATLRAYNGVMEVMPAGMRHWLARRMDATKAQPEDGAAFDLVRGSVNLMLAGMLIAWGTSMKLPLSTTFVTFMVAMGTSLADRAWGRESAVFRITGVISVIGGWFITAGVAFIGAGIVVCLMHKGGVPVMFAGAAIAVILLIRSNIRFKNKKKEMESDTLFQTILSTENPAEVWPLLRVYINEKERMFLTFAAEAYSEVTAGFINDDNKALSRSEKALVTEKDVLKGQRRKLTLCLRRVTPEIAMEKNTWFHLSNNMAMSMTYSLRRINEVCKEHVDNNFRPLPEHFHKSFMAICDKIRDVLLDAERVIEVSQPEEIDALRRRCERIKNELSARSKDAYGYIQKGDASNLTVVYVYLNVLQESQEFVTSLRKMLRASGKLNLAPSSYRSFTSPQVS